MAKRTKSDKKSDHHLRKIGKGDFPRKCVSLQVAKALTGTPVGKGKMFFVKEKDGELWFLELNPNGQWAWLDEKNEHGLISAIADAIIAEDLRHQ